MRPFRHAGGALLALTLLSAGRAAHAQPPPTMAPVDPAPGFLSRLRVLASIEALSEHETDYYWDADIGAGLDVVDYGHGRVHLSFNYEIVMGAALQPFDPWQSNYTIDLLGTLRRGAIEWGALFRHVSRHLGDRPKDFGIAWNDLGLQVLHTRQQGPWVWQVQGVALGTVARGFVDYAADLGGVAVFRRTMSSTVSVVGSGGGHWRFVRDSPLDRGTQTGGRAEIGLRVEGRSAALEIVGGAERRVDASPFEFRPRTWGFAALRILSR